MYLIKYKNEIIAVAYSSLGALTKLDSIIDRQNLTAAAAKKEYKKYTIEWREKNATLEELRDQRIAGE